MNFSLFARTTRINFLPASLVPFFTGAALAFRDGAAVSPVKFISGLLGVAAAHIAGNLFNDYYDHKSGADTVPGRRSVFFGGSGVIQEGLIPPVKVRALAFFFTAVSGLCGLTLLTVTKDPVFLLLMLAAAVLAFEYTAPPLKLAYNCLGELDIFFMFGVFLVTASYYLFAAAFTFRSLMVSLPVSFLISAVIFCNEVPDTRTDIPAGKDNLVTLFGRDKAHMVYLSLLALSYVSILTNVNLGVLSPHALWLTVFYPAGIAAGFILKNRQDDRAALIRSSALTIALHATVGLGLMIAVLIGG